MLGKTLYCVYILTHSHTLPITCTCCCDEIKGTQDQDFSYLFFDSHSLIMCLTMCLSFSACESHLTVARVADSMCAAGGVQDMELNYITESEVFIEDGVK